MAASLTISPHLYGLLLSIATRATRLGPSTMEDALAVFRHMEASGIKPSEAQYSCIIRICVLAGRPDEGRTLLARMVAQGTPPRLRSYASLIHGFAALGDLPSVRSTLADMAAQGVAASQREHANLLRILRAQGLEADGMRLLRSLVDEASCFVAQPVLASALETFFSPEEGASGGAGAGAGAGAGQPRRPARTPRGRGTAAASSSTGPMPCAP
jgi:pentatricopeptide repeat protein